MANQYLGEVIMLAGNTEPLGWAFCDGRLLSTNEPLFMLIGTTYGGDGVSNFALPDLRGRAPISAGQAPGLSPRAVGDRGGAETVTLTPAQLPAHTHPALCNTGPGDQADPINQLWAAAQGAPPYTTDATNLAPMGKGILKDAGANQPHENRMPYLSIAFLIALEGDFPTPP